MKILIFKNIYLYNKKKERKKIRAQCPKYTFYKTLKKKKHKEPKGKHKIRIKSQKKQQKAVIK